MSVHVSDSPRFLKLTLDSLVSQTLKASEVVLIKDGRLTTELNDLISLYKRYLNIKFISLDISKGLGFALKVGLLTCQNRLIARIDADDICYPNRFEKQVYEFKQDPSLDVVGSFATEIDRHDTEIGIRVVPVENNIRPE